MLAYSLPIATDKIFDIRTEKENRDMNKDQGKNELEHVLGFHSFLSITL